MGYRISLHACDPSKTETAKRELLNVWEWDGVFLRLRLDHLTVGNLTRSNDVWHAMRALAHPPEQEAAPETDPLYWAVFGRCVPTFLDEAASAGQLDTLRYNAPEDVKTIAEVLGRLPTLQVGTSAPGEPPPAASVERLVPFYREAASSVFEVFSLLM